MYAVLSLIQFMFLPLQMLVVYKFKVRFGSFLSLLHNFLMLISLLYVISVSSDLCEDTHRRDHDTQGLILGYN